MFLILKNNGSMKSENENENEDKKITAAKNLHSRYFFGTSGRNRTGTPESTGF